MTNRYHVDRCPTGGDRSATAARISGGHIDKVALPGDAGDIAIVFLLSVMAIVRSGNCCLEHVPIGGTMIEARMSMKSVRRQNGNYDNPRETDPDGARSFSGDTCSNPAPVRPLDPDASMDRGSGEQPFRLAARGLYGSRTGMA